MKKIVSLLVTMIVIITTLILPCHMANAMTPQEGANWALAQVGKWIDTDGAYGAQCVDLIVQYCKTNFGWNPQGSGNAEAYRTVKLPNSSWKRIKNTPDFIPQPGDIAIWNPASSNGNCGHVAIIISANINSFVSVDQNLKGSSNGSAAQKTTHNYNNFWGVIRPPFTSENAATSTVSKPRTVDDGLYTLKNASSGYMMNIYAGKDANGTKVTTWEFDGTTDQRIYIQHKGNGKYLLKFNASGSGMVIDVNRGASMTASIDDGDKIDIWTANDLDAQYFYINDVGKNAYTIELASKLGYVISATSDSAAKSNGTQLELKRYADKNYQKWYLCDISGKIIGSCAHSKTTNKTTDTSYTQKNDTAHTIITKYNEICADCGETVKANLTNEKTEAHSIKNNECDKCGYKIKIEEVCTHSNTSNKVTNTSYTQKNDTAHTIITKYNEICADCGEIVKSNLTNEKTETHSISNNLCINCGYTVKAEEHDESSKEQAYEPSEENSPAQDESFDETVCAHTNTYQGEIKSSTMKQKNNTHHSIKETYDVYCADCQKIVESSLIGTRTEEHSFVNNICQLCGYEDIRSSKAFPDVTDDELQTIIKELSGYGIINGYEDGSFRPFNNITRAEFSKMICTAVKFNTTGKADNNFEDVDSSHWAYNYIYTAKRLGIINGISLTAFAPEENITYEQTIKMIVAALGYNTEAIQKGGYPNGYIEIAEELGILYGLNYVNEDYATRANVAKMISAAMNVPFYELTENEGVVSRRYSINSLHKIYGK